MAEATRVQLATPARWLSINAFSTSALTSTPSASQRGSCAHQPWPAVLASSRATRSVSRSSSAGLMSRGSRARHIRRASDVATSTRPRSFSRAAIATNVRARTCGWTESDALRRLEDGDEILDLHARLVRGSLPLPFAASRSAECQQVSGVRGAANVPVIGVPTGLRYQGKSLSASPPRSRGLTRAPYRNATFLCRSESHVRRGGR